MLQGASQLASAKKPIDFDNLIDPEDLDTQKVIDWLRYGKNRFNIGKENQFLVHSLSDEHNRTKMAEVYAPHIKGFEKKPEVTLKAKKEITQEMINVLNEFPLPTKFPARRNLPVPPPNDALHSTGPLAESTLMLYNQILTPFIKTLTMIKYYSICTHQDGSDEIIHDIITFIEQSAKEPGISARDAAIKAKEKIKYHCEQHGIDLKIIAQKYAEDMTSGDFKKFPYAVAAVNQILNDVESYKYVRNILKHMYVLMVNEVKVYQQYDEKQKIFKQAESDKSNIRNDLTSFVITGAAVPSGKATSSTIKPIDRPLISLDASSELVEIKKKIAENNIAKIPNMTIIQSGARYRLICNKDKYILAAEDRYAPQLFLKMKYVMDMDIEFALDLRSCDVTIYRINQPVKNTGLYLSAYPYDPGLIKQYQNRIKFAINNGLSVTQDHQAVLIGDRYSQGDSNVDYLHGPYKWQGVETINSQDYNLLVKYQERRMPNRTKIKQCCDGDIDIKYAPPKDLIGHRIKEFPLVDLPDYMHYNYAYECAYDIDEIYSVSVQESRKWFREKKKNQRLAKYRKFMALGNEFKDVQNKIVEY